MNNTEYSINARKKASILDDKSFVLKFVFLIISIILVSIFGLIQDRVLINDSTFSSLKLKTIEDSLSEYGINLSVISSDFDNLQELDLSNIELVSEKIDNKPHVYKTSATNNNINNKASYVNYVIANKEQNNKKSEHKSKRVIITSGSIKSLSFMKQKFYKTNNIKYSLLISEKFLEHDKYQKALKWALISNEIDDKNEKSWILFAKAKIKMGQKKDAIAALRAYLKNSNSSNVKRVLDDITKNS